MDLLMESNSKEGFRCEACYTTVNGRQESTKLVLLSSTASESEANANEELKNKFNVQLQPIIQQLNVVERALMQQLQA